MAANVRDAIGKEPVPGDVYVGEADDEILDAGGDVIADVADITRQYVVDTDAKLAVRRARTAE
ncbi:MAG: hypothetical protein IJQ73_08545 [Kiritimatiellae bacterium]|nr:hypothetical protein [Kiritimatiellia bacterium]